MSIETPYNAAVWLVDRQLAAGNGDRVALRYQGTSISYAHLHKEILTRQSALAAIGIGPGDRVALIVRDEPRFVSWFLGSLRAGAIPVPLSTMLNPAEVAAIVADSGAKLVVVSSASAGHLERIELVASCVVDAVVLTSSENDPLPTLSAVRVVSDSAACSQVALAKHEPLTPHATTAESPAFWLYSSGTTGIPKGVMHRHGSLEQTARTYAAEVLRFAPEDRALSVAKLFFAFGLGNSLTFPLAVGASSVLNPDPPTPALVAELLTSERPTLFFASPGFIAALLDADVHVDAFSSVRLTITAGEALPADLARRFAHRYGHPVLDGLGTSEALHIFVSNTVDDQRDGTSGIAVPGYEVELRNDGGQRITDPDTPGFLHVKGPSIAEGYWNQPEATANAFVDGWLRTGDVYLRSVDGFYKFLGRNNDMIKAGGIWVSPAEVESVLVEHPDVLEAAVVGSPNAEGLETTVAFLVARAGRSIDEATIDSHCRERMAAFKRPRRVVIVASLPKTATGKVQRFALRKLLEEETR